MERGSYTNCEMFFENPIPKILLPEITEVIDGMNIQKNWFFVILFGNNNIFFDNQEGKYMNIINNGLIFLNTPQEITAFIAKDKKNKINYSFIWFPKKLLSSDKFVIEEKTNFFWNLVHELQHLKQDAYFGTQILKVNSFLREALIENSNPPKINYIDLPAEFDAYKKAKEVIVNKFGNELFSNFLKFKKDKLLKKTKNKKNESLNLIQKIDVKMNYRVKNEFLKLIKSNKDFLNKKLTEFNSLQKYLSIDIDAICETGDVCFTK